MDAPFIYNKPVSGKNYIGRSTEANILTNMLTQGENIAIYEPPKTGKTSLIRQAFLNMSQSGRGAVPVEFRLLNIRTLADFTTRFGSAVMKACFSSPADFERIAGAYLEDTHLRVDHYSFSDTGLPLILDGDVDSSDIAAVLKLPYQIGTELGRRICIVLDDFANIMDTEDGDLVCKILHEIFKALTPERKEHCNYIFVGSRVNAMNDIFEDRKLFYRTVEHIELGEIDTKDIIDHIVKGFLSSGKVLDRDLMLGVCKLFRGNIWYISHLSAICDSMSKGYVMEPVLVEALDSLISIHEPRFIATMNSLTTFQISLLRAILDGNIKFSSSDVVQRYKLNSSANVVRLKDALCKKEIVTFNEQDEPRVLDPLFEYWIRRRYFEID